MTATRTPVTDELTRRRQQSEGFTSAGMVAALEGAWSTIRGRHPDVPAVVMVIGSGAPARANGRLTLGHFAALQWQHGDNRIPEVLVSGEGLRRPAGEVLATLLHEAAHGIAHTRGMKDTSRQGRWHNKQFAALAGEVGLAVTKDDRIGWSPSELTLTTRTAYVSVVEQLSAAIQVYRHSDGQPETSRRSSNNGRALTCDCPRRIRAAAAVIAEGPILCGVCDQEFLSDDPNEASEGDQP